jgi:hypothetical protein
VRLLNTTFCCLSQCPTSVRSSQASGFAPRADQQLPPDCIRIRAGTATSLFPTSVFFPSLAAMLYVTRIGRFEWSSKPIRHVTIPRRVQILCSECFSYCKSLSSISYKTDSELTSLFIQKVAGAECDAFAAWREGDVSCGAIGGLEDAQRR